MYETGILKGIAPASRVSGVPRSRPNHSRSPAALVGPSQIFRIADASAAVKHVSAEAPARHTAATGSYVHARGSPMTPSTTPSSPSQAAMAAFVVAVSFASLMGAPNAPCITICGQSPDGMKRSQLIAGATMIKPS
jgi:hypothetical protein